MKISLKLFLVSFVFVLSSSALSDTQSVIVSSVYMMELLVMGGASLALIIIFLMMLKDRRQHGKKMALFYAEMEHRKTIAQLMMCSVHEKAQDITRVSGLLNSELMTRSNHESRVGMFSDNKPMRLVEKESKIDPRHIAADGSTKHNHLGKANYVACMLDMHLEGLRKATEAEKSLRLALVGVQDEACNNLEGLMASHQSLSNTIGVLELEAKEKKSTASISNDKILKELIRIRGDFNDLIAFQQQNKSIYDSFGLKLQQNEKSSVITVPDELNNEFCSVKQCRA